MNIHFEECRGKTRFESDHVWELSGQKIPCHTICEDNFFYNEEGKPVATIYSYSYFRSDTKDNSGRPVIFACNGGPGSSSVWIHLGLLGPRRVKLGEAMPLPTVPPFELEDNPNCPLALCDIVIVDLAGTGLGRLFDESAKPYFYDAEADIRQLALFMEGWLTRYGRRNSPVFLAGESYSTGRLALLAAELLGGGLSNNTTLGISVSGMLLLGTYFYEPIPFPGAILHLPSMAAANWYHFPEGKPDLEEFVEKAYEFAAGDYLMAYMQGSCLSRDRLGIIVGRLMYFTGLKKGYLEENWMNLTLVEFRKRLLEDRHEVTAYYDARYTWQKLPGVPDANVIADDPAMGRYIPAYQAGFDCLRRELNIAMDRANIGVDLTIGEQWRRSERLKPAHALAQAMRRNPKLQVLFASGLYDLCTPAGNARYLAAHSNLDMGRVHIREYPSGHMAYLGDSNAKLLGDDFKKFIGDVLKDQANTTVKGEVR